MKDEAYWKLFQRVWKTDDTASPYEILEGCLSHLELEELLDFAQRFNFFRASLQSPGHLAAAFLLHEGTLDDEDFLEYLEAIAAVPEGIYFDVQGTPDHILDHPLYSDILRLDGYPFASASDVIGMRRFGELWRVEFKKRSLSRIAIDCVLFNGGKGLEILTPCVCEILVPRLYQIYGENCDW